MRNFIVAFMVLILLSSIMLVILRPIPQSEQKAPSKEKSHVEELLTGSDNKLNNQEDEKNINIEEKKQSIDELTFDKNNFNENMNNNYIPPQNISNTPSEEKKTETENYKVINNNLQDITKELSEKYGNNPNAEVSPEDIEFFMLKLLEQQK